MHSQTREYLEILISRGFLPVITLPTRIFEKSATLIDHIFTNKQSECYEGFIITSCISDHFPTIYVEHDKTDKLPYIPQKVRMVNDKTIPSFCNILRCHNWDNLYNDPQKPENAFNFFYETINNAAETSFPEKNVYSRSKKMSHEPWITPGLLISQRQKQKLFSLKLRKPTDTNKQKFRNYNNMYNKLRRKARKDHYNERFLEFSSNIKKNLGHH